MKKRTLTNKKNKNQFNKSNIIKNKTLNIKNSQKKDLKLSNKI